MTHPDFKLSLTQNIARLTLSRPAKRNALTRELLAALCEAVREISALDHIRLMILEAEGPVFCAGMDLAQMQATAAAPNCADLWSTDAQLYCDLLLGIWRLAVPTVAVIQGPVLAGGVGLALACDLIVASETATFSLPEPKRGITAAIVTPLLVHRIGSGASAHLLLSGRVWDARHAFQRGLCDELVAPDQLPAAVSSLTASILTSSPAALRLTKSQWRSVAAASMAEQLTQAVAQSAQARETGDAREGLQAFLEKRNPVWMSIE